MDPEELGRIRSIAGKILESRVPNKALYFSSIYGNFAKKYPILYEKVCSPSCDTAMLNYMFTMMEGVSTGKQTNDAASVEVGQKLFDKYVATVVDVEKLKRKD